MVSKQTALLRQLATRLSDQTPHVLDPTIPDELNMDVSGPVLYGSTGLTLISTCRG